MRAKIRANRAAYDEILCLYGDCGTGGALDRVLAEEGVKRIAGAHCYAFYAGEETFAALAEEEPGTFYLTDFLARHFDALVIKGLGLDRFPQLRDDYFRAIPSRSSISRSSTIRRSTAKAEAAAASSASPSSGASPASAACAHFLHEQTQGDAAERTQPWPA